MSETTLFDLSAGQAQELFRKLAGAMPYKQAQRVLANENGLEDWALQYAETVRTKRVQAAQIYSLLPWWTSTQRQIAKAKTFLCKYAAGLAGFDPESDIPPAPTNVQLRDGEVPLLMVYLPDQKRRPGYLVTLDAWWDFCEAPAGFSKTRWSELKSDSKTIRQIEGAEWQSGIRWIIYNHKSYQGKSCQQAKKLARQDGVNLAGVEVIAAMAMFPKWVKSWNGEELPYQNCPGLEMFYNSRWSSLLDVRRDDCGRELGLNALSSGFVSFDWACPSFRKCT